MVNIRKLVPKKDEEITDENMNNSDSLNYDKDSVEEKSESVNDNNTEVDFTIDDNISAESNNSSLSKKSKSKKHSKKSKSKTDSKKPKNKAVVNEGVEWMLINFVETKWVDWLKDVLKTHINKQFEFHKENILRDNLKIQAIFDKNLKNNTDATKLIRGVLGEYDSLKNTDFKNWILSDEEVEELKKEWLKSIGSSIHIVLEQYADGLQSELAMIQEFQNFESADWYEEYWISHLEKQNIPVSDINNEKELEEEFKNYVDGRFQKNRSSLHNDKEVSSQEEIDEAFVDEDSDESNSLSSPVVENNESDNNEESVSVVEDSTKISVWAEFTDESIPFTFDEDIANAGQDNKESEEKQEETTINDKDLNFLDWLSDEIDFSNFKTNDEADSKNINVANVAKTSPTTSTSDDLSEFDPDKFLAELNKTEVGSQTSENKDEDDEIVIKI